VTPAPRAARESPPTRAEPADSAYSELLTIGLNPLVQAGSALLVLAGRLRDQIARADNDTLRRQVTSELRQFEDKARQSGVPTEDIRRAGYVLCGVIDEAVMNTPWGAQSGWSAESLQSTLYSDTFVGEKFFLILNEAIGQTQRHIALLELLYVCLSLGFEGKYRVDANGTAKLAQVRSDLYRRILSARGAGEADLSAHWRGVEDRRNAVMRFVPLWIVGAASVALLIGAFILFSSLLSSRAEALNARLAQVGLTPELPPAPKAALPVDNGLRVVLAQPIAQGLLDVEETSDRASITILGGDLFASGSARLNPRYGPLLHQIANALESRAGQLEVIGHTDNRPIQSLTYKDNYELSRDRAQQVADLLRSGLSNPARVGARGVGPSQPRYQPESDPANQARNRRVEILYRRGT
jgi:type VI secretion system protein ImpK